MTFSKLQSPKTTDRVPKGRKSWKGAMKQVEGNLQWMLSFLQPEEIVEKIASEKFRLEETKTHKTSHRYAALHGLFKYHIEMAMECSKEINHMSKYADAEDLKSSPSNKKPFSTTEKLLFQNQRCLSHTETERINLG